MLKETNLQPRIIYQARFSIGIERQFTRKAKTKGVHDHWTRFTRNIKKFFNQEKKSHTQEEKNMGKDTISKVKPDI